MVLKTIFYNSFENRTFVRPNLKDLLLMEIFIKASQFILSLSLLIVLHELGHFIPAKLFKTKVEKFYLFFDYKFSLLKKKVGETVYGIGWIPLGGYVKIAGMIDESMDKEQLKQEPKPWEFRSKPAWQRLIIMLGGVFVNFVLGIFIYIMLMYSYGESYLPNYNLKDGIWVQDSLAMEIGLKTGDKIISVDGEKIERFRDFRTKLIAAEQFTIDRNGEKITNHLPVNFIGKLVDNYSKRRGNLVQYRVPFMVSRFSDDSVNKSSGILTKDILVEIDSIPIRYFDEVSSILAARKNKVVLVKVKRDKEFLEYSLMVNEDGKFGIYPTDLELNTLEKLGYYNLEKINYSFTEAIPAGFNASYDKLVSYIDQMKLILTPETEAYKGVGGFISIANIFPPEWDWYLFWNMTALLSIILGFMNLLPIPALDGGHVMFTLWEMVTGRKPSDKFLEYAQITGFILLIALLLFANGNDVLRLFQ